MREHRRHPRYAHRSSPLGDRRITRTSQGTESPVPDLVGSRASTPDHPKPPSAAPRSVPSFFPSTPVPPPNAETFEVPATTEISDIPPPTSPTEELLPPPPTPTTPPAPAAR